MELKIKNDDKSKQIFQKFPVYVKSNQINDPNIFFNNNPGEGTDNIVVGQGCIMGRMFPKQLTPTILCFKLQKISQYKSIPISIDPSLFVDYQSFNDLEFDFEYLEPENEWKKFSYQKEMQISGLIYIQFN